MSGSQYIALSGLRARADDLDRIATDIANIGTAGYKGERESRAAAERAQFDDVLRTAVDATHGGRRLDVAAGAITGTGRSLDVAIDGKGFFVIETAAGPRYTRNGHFTIDASSTLVTEDGSAVRGTNGPITVGKGEIRIDEDGTIWSGTTRAGTLEVVEFQDAGQLKRENAMRLDAAGQTPTAVEAPTIRAGALEQSNVSVAERLAELTTVSRSFEALQRSISVLMNDVDGRAIDHLGRRS